MSNGRYVAGSYTASFVGLFPADNPQFVILVKLDNPRGAYYGGKTAGTVSRRVVLEAALAARDAALDRNALTRSARTSRCSRRRTAAPKHERRHADSARDHRCSRCRARSRAETPARDPGENTSVPFVVSLAERERAPAAARSRRGRSRRAAARASRRRCTRCTSPGSVCSSGRAQTASTAPAAGTPLRTGSIVRLYTAAMTSFASRAIRDALARAGVLREVAARCLHELAGITDDSRSGRTRAHSSSRCGAPARDGHDFLSAIAERAARRSSRMRRARRCRRSS